MQRWAVTKLLLLLLLRSTTSFVLGNNTNDALTSRNFLCNDQQFYNISKCEQLKIVNTADDTYANSNTGTDNAEELRLLSTSQTTNRMLFATPHSLLSQCKETLQNQSYWTWQVKCNYLEWLDDYKMLVQEVRLDARQGAGKWWIQPMHFESLTDNCIVIVHPVSKIDYHFSKILGNCSDKLFVEDVPSEDQRQYPASATFRPLIANDNIYISVTFTIDTGNGRQFVSCPDKSLFQPWYEACLPESLRTQVAMQGTEVSLGAIASKCTGWLRFNQYTSAIDQSSLTITLNATQYHLRGDQYYVTANTNSVYVCESALTEHLVVDDWQKSLERCLFIVSALADLANILAHLILRAQRTLPGRIVLCLSGTLFASDLSCFLLTFIRSVETVWVCFAVRSVAHYLSLSASCWTQVLWYDLWLSISASRTVDVCRDMHGRFTRYLLFSWVLPLLFPTTRLILDAHSTLHVPSDGDDAEFRKLLVCYQNQLIYYLTFSAIPVSCILVMNTVFLTRSCCLIRRVALDTERVGISNNFMNPQQRFGLYTKLFFLCGFTSLFGFASEILRSQSYASERLNEVLSQISGILDSSLGLCVSLPFLCEPRVGMRFVRTVFAINWTRPRSRSRHLHRLSTRPRPRTVTVPKIIINHEGTSPTLCNQVKVNI